VPALSEVAKAVRKRSPLGHPGGDFEARLFEKVSGGGKFLAVYVTAGLPEPSRFLDLVRRISAAGADAVEIGIPFSDPVMDGPIIQQASKAALEWGITPRWAVEAASSLEVEASLVVMTYFNLAYKMGLDEFASSLAQSGIGGAILADLPIEESDEWVDVASKAGVAPILLAAPNASDERLAQICSRSRGFVYGISLLGVTGPRAGLSGRAKEIGDRLRKFSDIPVGVGIGISSGSQAKEVAEHCDGVIVGSAVIDRILRATDADEAIASAERFVAELREALGA
jgi:tryptophan synthase alpha chain